MKKNVKAMLPRRAQRAPLGTGERFRALQSKLASRPGVKNPAALAAYIGRSKYGAKKMAKLAAKGRG